MDRLLIDVVETDAKAPVGKSEAQGQAGPAAAPNDNNIEVESHERDP
ncbi:MAG: hypothetical protein ACRDH8_07315 [Actinomycetota bacterium]